MSTEYLQEKKNKRKNFFGKIFGIIFIVWFVASIVGMFLLQDTLYCVMLFGQYFLVFGLIPLFTAEKFEKLISVPFLLVGICCVVVPYCMMHPELIPTDVDWDYVIVILLLLAFLLAGLGMIFIPLFKRRYLKRVCNYSVTAKIVEYDTTRSDGKTLYCPIYGFWYNGKDWKVSNNTYTNIGLKELGTECELMINPENPEEFYYTQSVTNLFIMIMGFAFLVFVIPILIYVINNGLA